MKTKGSKQDSEIRLALPMPEGDEGIFLHYLNLNNEHI
jgi:hypothetical protein